MFLHSLHIILQSDVKNKVMKLAEALSIRADLQKQGGQLKTRMKSCVKVQEGDIKSLRKKVDDCSGELRRLDLKIQSLNWTTDFIESGV